MAKLELQNLQKRYSSKVIPVKNIALAVENGEFLTLLGPSGCGKSTLLRLIAGLEQPTQGNIILGEKNLNKIPPGDRNMAMVFQSYALYPHMSAAENIATALKLRKMPAEEIQQRIAEAAQQLELTHLLDRKPGQMSGGQRQRVALARALVRNPEVFLLDEPLSNLDALLREQVRAQLKQLFKEQNKPVVYVTHDQTEAMTLSTKVAVLYDGLVQQLDPPSKIYTHPANQFVAGFVGSPQMNLLTLKCQGNTAILGDANLPLPPLATIPPQIMLGIRPEDVELAQFASDTTVTGEIYLVEQLGKENLISVQVANSNQNLRILLPIDRKWEGDTVLLNLPTTHLHWFDLATGDRI
ncbi:carbohydrate ABC transporter ATP-binding protein, CUT1 family [Stanieria cyanosphaera PCC 7437]|uniref:Carbohydrate ABC transporter ATP-binding protein, CUT1 family n=1 Tax=Stanieria cyanosphaera (strain ATCC 29371 / PCC 7437) TaxID=111780 RepID=K9XVR3_STAC7|nr:ABC transporter ATP-binding protein [Stanieria cyanosphaera]AFZ36618.1 carbohydrate ABC transporter ATP-binding protein, CUT1 family [Stanieria cyanosphaera PCC 7437]